MIAVKREYELRVDPAEPDALEILLTGVEAELNCVGPDSVPGRLEFAHFANGLSITSDLVLVNVVRSSHPSLALLLRPGRRKDCSRVGSGAHRRAGGGRGRKLNRSD